MKGANIQPELHGDLIVRVGGYSAPYAELDPSLQDELIRRYGV